LLAQATNERILALRPRSFHTGLRSCH
jgi:hypothetical protein